MKKTIRIKTERVTYDEVTLANMKGDTFSFNPHKHEGLADFILSAEKSPYWKTLNWGLCDSCGGDAEAFTDLDKPNHIYDGDKARCIDCGLEGTCVADGEGGAYVDWNEY